MKQRKRKFEEKRQAKASDANAQTEARDPGSTAMGADDAHGTVDSIAKDAMLGEPKPSEERWPGRETDDPTDVEAEDKRELEKQNFVQEELYIHGKVCRTSITTSADSANIWPLASHRRRPHRHLRKQQHQRPITTGFPRQ